MASLPLEKDVIRRGYLSLVRNPKYGLLGSLTSSVSSKRQWVVLRRETARGGQSRLELYRSEEQTVDGRASREVVLDAIKLVEHAEKKKAFVLHMQDETLLFLCSSHAEMEDWIGDIRRFRRAGSLSGEFPDNSMGQELYEELPDDERYPVVVRKSSTLRFSGPCFLEILRDFERNLFHIALFTKEEPSRLIVKWQIDHVRQYGSNELAFKFQSGSKSPTGVDWFMADTEHGDAPRIHKAVDYWAKHIVDQVKNMVPSRSHTQSRPHSISDGRRHGSNEPTSPNGPIVGSAPTYTRLSADTRQVSSVYDDPNQPQVPARPPRSSAKPPQTHYQAIDLAGRESFYDNNYQDLNRLTRSRQPGGASAPSQPPHNSRSGSNALYMGLTPQTRSANESSYMGLKEARSEA